MSWSCSSFATSHPSSPRSVIAGFVIHHSPPLRAPPLCLPFLYRRIVERAKLAASAADRLKLPECPMNPNVALARRWFEEVWNLRKTETVKELLTAQSVCQSEAGELKGPEAFLTQAYGPLLTAFPDLSVTLEGTVAEDDQVVVRWRATGTHTGSAMGLPPTGRRLSFRGMTWIRYRDGKMIEGRDSWNMSGLVQTMRGGEPSASVEL